MSATYQIYGLTDCSYVLRVGEAIVTVQFTGGSTSKYGTTPATFTTDSEGLQKIIERTHDYETGKIKRAQR